MAQNELFHHIDPGEVGIVKDLPPHTMDPNVWSDGINVNFDDLVVTKTKGTRQVFGTPLYDPHWASPVRTPQNYYWMYSDLAKVAVWDGSIHTDITRVSGGDYSVVQSILWNGGVFGGIPIINNGVDVPQMWTPVSTAQPLQALSNWPGTLRALVLRPFKNFLIAFNVTKSGTQMPHMVKWSHAAVPGSVPSSWDETDETLDAGEFELNDSNAGFIRDALQLGDYMIIYKDQSVWSLSYTGSKFIFNNEQEFENLGILHTNCVAQLPNLKTHFVMTGDDIIVHNLQNPESVLNRKDQKYLNNDIDPSNYINAYCVANKSTKEMMFCYPQVGVTYPNKALIWNYEENTVSFRDLENISWIAQGVIEGTEDLTGDEWDGVDETWDAGFDGKNDTWDEITYKPYSNEVLLCQPGGPKLFQGNVTEQLDGIDMYSFVSRIEMSMDGADPYKRKPKAGFDHRKQVNRIWPKMTATGPVTIYIGMSEERGGTITWSNALMFDPSIDKYVDLEYPISGRLMALKIESNSDITWTYEGMDVEYSMRGRF